jgi:hypothetical protein
MKIEESRPGFRARRSGYSNKKNDELQEYVNAFKADNALC